MLDPKMEFKKNFEDYQQDRYYTLLYSIETAYGKRLGCYLRDSLNQLRLF